jgi:hypothetical protein
MIRAPRGGWTFFVAAFLCLAPLGADVYGQRRVPPDSVPMLPPGAQPFPQPAPGFGEGLPGAHGEAPKLLTATEVRALADRLHRESIAGYLKAKCFACHSDAKVTAGLNLQRLLPDFVSADSAERWQRVYERLRDKEMPPGPKPAPAKVALPIGPLPPGVVPEPEPPPDPRYVALDAIGKVLSSSRHLRPNGNFDVTPIVVGPAETYVRRLMMQKRDAVAEMLAIKRQQYQFGGAPLADVISGIQSLTRAELALATTDEQRVRLLRRQVDFSRRLEDDCFGKTEGGFASFDEFYAAKEARLGAQIELQLLLEKR